MSCRQLVKLLSDVKIGLDQENTYWKKQSVQSLDQAVSFLTLSSIYIAYSKTTNEYFTGSKLSYPYVIRKGELPNNNISVREGFDIYSIINTCVQPENTKISTLQHEGNTIQFQDILIMRHSSLINKKNCRANYFRNRNHN
jgi:hypothetical protein